MSFIELQQVYLSTLSPVQLGSGEDFYPTNYVITEDSWLHHFDEMAISNALKGNLSQLTNAILSGRGDDMILSIQKIILKNATDLAKLSFYSLPVSKGFLNFYQSRIGQVAQQESNKKRVVNRLQISRTFIHPHTHVPVIPGSAIKGAIRTAVINQLAQNKLEKLKPLAKDKFSSKKIQEELLKYSRVDKDPMKYFKVSDSQYEHDYIASEILFSVSRKRKPKANYEPAEGISTYMEVMSPYRFQAYEFDMRFIEAANPIDTIDIPKSFSDVAKACNAYYLPKLKLELAQLSDQAEYLDSNYAQTIHELLTNEWEIMFKANKIFILRIGKFSGAQDKTLDGLKKIKILTPKDQPDDFRSETTEVRLAAEIDPKQKHGLLPFGWVLVQQKGLSLPQTAEALDKLAKLRRADQHVNYMQDLKWDKQNAQQMIEKERVARAELFKNQLEKQQALDLEQAKIQVMKESLTDEQRKIFEFSQKAQSDTTSKGAGSALYGELRELIMSTQSWSAQDKASLRDVAKKVFIQLGVDAKANKPKELLKMVPAL